MPLWRSPPNAPPITSLGRVDLVRWRRAYRDYCRDMALYCRAVNVPLAGCVASWTSCVDPDLLRVACEFDWHMDPASLTERGLRTRLATIMETPHIKSADDIRKCFASLHMPLSPTGDANGQRLDFMEAALQTEMATYGRLIVAAIVERVQPAILRERVRARLEIAPNDSLKVFANILLEQLQALNECEHLQIEDSSSLRRSGGVKKRRRVRHRSTVGAEMSAATKPRHHSRPSTCKKQKTAA
ncbi:hypothetical protein SDRG_04721 [Saprolegnia diclina VS20]|uniref:Uncharacterized protein n=1 Tax=Saprolegnia diclina (strain VS20) TaxID=1156394 RepID=T0S4M6_SAPDV|nr:hypothetical protein SDRG_04721 [Saprolegnia diclina VS20]EQC37692.1 hypothetical protein SDRG_04721 [Saprolegnia diclina VS20]|eukprot:XP_008608625.1 hypothetical protein SDRG_04721 [Saprolegnia diclina VS20]